MKFHFHTLKLYCALCAVGNNRIAHALCSHIDQAQLIFTTEDKYLPGLLRSGFYDLLLSMHLESAKEARLIMNNEFIIPVTDETRSITLFPKNSRSYGCPGVGLSTCLRPRLNFSSPCFVSTIEDRRPYSPKLPFDILKVTAIEMLTEAVTVGGPHIRDPVGGSVQFHLVPILKLIKTMLITGMFDDNDVQKILLLIDSDLFGEHQEEMVDEGKLEKEIDVKNEEKAIEAGEVATQASPPPLKGLLEKSLPESVKLQVQY